MAQVTRTSEEILPEDRVTNAFIDASDQECFVEVPYNNYGERGYVDLVINRKGVSQIFELKSSPKSANQVIRQFQKMRENFSDGTSIDLRDTKTFYLTFTASQKNIQHLKNNKSMYLSLLDDGIRITMADEDARSRPVFMEDELREEKLSELKGVNIDDELICPYCGKEYEMEGYFKKHVQGCVH